MIRKKNPLDILSFEQSIALTDDRRGSGQLRLVPLKSEYRANPNPRPNYGDPNYYNWSWGEYVHSDYVVRGDMLGSKYFSPTFELKRHEGGVILPVSLTRGTVFATEAEARVFGEEWLAAGAPGIQLETPAETKQRELEQRSAAYYPEAARVLSSLTDEDLLRLAEAATNLIAKRAATAEARAAREAERERKIEEKARIAAEKAQAKADKLAEKTRKAAEAAAKKAEREAKKAAKAG